MVAFLTAHRSPLCGPVTADSLSSRSAGAAMEVGVDSPPLCVTVQPSQLRCDTMTGHNVHFNTSAAKPPRPSWLSEDVLLVLLLPKGDKSFIVGSSCPQINTQ